MRKMRMYESEKCLIEKYELLDMCDMFKDYVKDHELYATADIVEFYEDTARIVFLITDTFTDLYGGKSCKGSIEVHKLEDGFDGFVLSMKVFNRLNEASVIDRIGRMGVDRHWNKDGFIENACDLVIDRFLKSIGVL